MKIGELAEQLVKSPLVVVFLVGLVAFLVGIEVLNFKVDWIQLDASKPPQKAVLLLMSAFLLGIPLWAFVKDYQEARRYGVTTDSRSQRKQYERSMNEGDLEGAREVHEQSALSKLKSQDLERAKIGVREVAELGSRYPFKRGFNALARELGRRNDWFLRLEILAALEAVAEPLRRQIQES